jgi:hypothetical protein
VNGHGEVVFRAHVPVEAGGPADTFGLWTWNRFSGVRPVAVPGGQVELDGATVSVIRAGITNTDFDAGNTSKSRVIGEDGLANVTVVHPGGKSGEIYVRALVALEFPSPDLDNDGSVNGADLGLLLASWETCGECDADLNADGVVDALDLALLLGSWS